MSVEKTVRITAVQGGFRLDVEIDDEPCISATVLDSGRGRVILRDIFRTELDTALPRRIHWSKIRRGITHEWIDRNYHGV